MEFAETAPEKRLMLVDTKSISPFRKSSVLGCLSLPGPKKPGASKNCLKARLRHWLEAEVPRRASEKKKKKKKIVYLGD
jgi:hypothetical protein